MIRRLDAGRSSITWDDTWQHIEVNGYVLNISPTQYRICRAFLSSSSAPKGIAGDLLILGYRSCCELQEETKMSHRLLIKHISNINTRIIQTGLQLCSFQTGYILTVSSNSALKVRQCE